MHRLQGFPGEFDVDERSFDLSRRLARVRDHFHRHLDGDARLATAASIAGMERRYFSAFFHAKTGVCYKDWIQRLRIGRAIELIRGGNGCLADVAFAVGFEDVRSFQRTFKKLTRMTAREFKLAAGGATPATGDRDGGA